MANCNNVNKQHPFSDFAEHLPVFQKHFKVPLVRLCIRHPPDRTGHAEPNRLWQGLTCSSWRCSTSSHRQPSTAFHRAPNWWRQRQGSRHLSRWSPTSVSRSPWRRALRSPVTLFSVHEILISNKYAILPPPPPPKCLWWAERWHEDMNRCYSCRNPFCPPPLQQHPPPSLCSPVPWISFLCWAPSLFLIHILVSSCFQNFWHTLRWITFYMFCPKSSIFP